MQPTELCRYLCVALTIPLGIPYVLTLFGEWRLPATVVHRRLLLVMLCHCGLCALLYCTAGSGPTARLLLGTLPLALYWALFWAHTKYRDSRLLFTLITVTLLCTMTDMLCFLFLRYGSPYWLAVKLALCAAITLVLRVFVRRPFRAMLRSTDEGWTYVCLIPLSLLLCLLFCGTLPAVFGWALHARIITMLLGATALLIYFTWYRFFQLLRGQYRAEQDAAVLFTQIESLEQQTRQLQEADRQNAILRHDLRHFVRLLDGSLRTHDVKQAGAVLRSLEERFEAPARPGMLRCYTGNTLIDAVLSMGAARAAQERTQFSVRVTLPEPLRVSPPELAVVTSNALENAFNACAALPPGLPRSVCITGGAQGRQYLLSIRNTVAEPVPLDACSGLPTTEKPGHGYGMQSIAAFAEKYGAFLHCATEDSEFRFSLLL